MSDAVLQPQSPVLFAQTREDAELDLRLLDAIAIARGDASDGSISVAMIASGGCTCFAMMSDPRVGRIEAVDLSLPALHTVRLKQVAIATLPRRDALGFFGCLPPDSACAGNSPDERIATYRGVLREQLALEAQRFWDDHIAWLALGVHQCGRYEQTFRTLAQALGPELIAALGSSDPLVRLQAVESPAWSAAFGVAFEIGALTAAFTAAAVSFSMSRRFDEHFASVFAAAIARYPSSGSPFLHQALHGCYRDAGDGSPPALPVYLRPSVYERVQAALRRPGPPVLRLAHESLSDCLGRGGAAFDFVGTSNVTDWLAAADVRRLMAQAAGCLRPGTGALIARRLNGDHSLRAEVGAVLAVDEALTAAMSREDLSFFYSEVVVGWARQL